MTLLKPTTIRNAYIVTSIFVYSLFEYTTTVD